MNSLCAIGRSVLPAAMLKAVGSVLLTAVVLASVSVALAALLFAPASVSAAEPAGEDAAAKPRPAKPFVDRSVVFEEVDGVVAVEAEHFQAQTPHKWRAWFLFTADDQPNVEPDGDPPHLADASGGAYLEILPDTRRGHDDPLKPGVNFSSDPGKIGILHYRVHFNTPGRYYVWARIYSTTTEDNGLHVGIDGAWPESGQRMQWTGKNRWVWGSKQRTARVHTGEPHKLYLDIAKPGEHVISFSMREDGTEFDKWMMTTEKLDKVEGPGPKTRLKKGELPKLPGSAGEGAESRPAADDGNKPLMDLERDLLCLHYDHAPDKDDGHSAAADLTILHSLYGRDWVREHVVPVSGAYGKNHKTFNKASDKVMDATWKPLIGWAAADRDRAAAVRVLALRWVKTLRLGGDVWVKEGGQSDITAELVRLINKHLPEVDTTKRIHVVQHSGWNENQTTEVDLAYVKAHTDYIRIKDANRFLNVKGGDEAFEKAAVAHPLYGKAWKAAFEYYPPRHRLDFSDTGELMHILRLGEIGIDAFRERFLEGAEEEPGDGD